MSALMQRKTWLSFFALVATSSSVYAGSNSTNSTNPGLASAAGVYNTSSTPANLPWNTYNYCNAPHVNADNYTKPSVAGAKLVYLNTITRHHMRTPDNLYPTENPLNTPWDCSNFLQYNSGGPGGARGFHQTVIPSWHPFLPLIWNGTCDEGQLTREGFDNAVKHGSDFMSVYGKKLGLLKSVNEEDILVRTSASDRTMQVASAFLAGMDPSVIDKPFPVSTQPGPIDNITPSYPCPHADAIRDAYQSVPAWTNHLQQNADLKARLDEMLGTTGLDAWASWYDHFFDTFTSRTCHGHPLPCNATGACVSVEDALQVFAIGDFEYNYIWSAAENSTVYTQETIGAFMQELWINFSAFKAGKETYKWRYHSGHDGTMIRLQSALGFGDIASLRWPALGSEINMEVWEASGQHFVRVIHEGTVKPTFEWMPLDDFISLLASQIPPNLFQACNASFP